MHPLFKIKSLVAIVEEYLKPNLEDLRTERSALSSHMDTRSMWQKHVCLQQLTNQYEDDNIVDFFNGPEWVRMVDGLVSNRVYNPVFK